MENPTPELVIVEGWRGAVRMPLPKPIPAHQDVPEHVAAISRRLTDRGVPFVRHREHIFVSLPGRAA